MKQEYKKPEISTVQMEMECACLGYTWMGSLQGPLEPGDPHIY